MAAIVPVRGYRQQAERVDIVHLARTHLIERWMNGVECDDLDLRYI